MNNWYAYTTLFAGLDTVYKLSDCNIYLSPNFTDFKNFCMSNKARVKRIKNRRRK